MALLLFTSFLFHAQARVTCMSGDCNINCSSQNCDIIICTNQASSCTITCQEGQCDASTFYLAASDYNTVDCNGFDSCNDINIQCGLPSIIPNHYEMSDFIGHINECTFLLRHNAISNGGRIQCVGNIDLCQMYALTDNADFNASQFECNLTPQNAECIMSCNSNISCGDGTSSFDCIAPQCNQISINIATGAPTNGPSKTPTDIPTTSIIHEHTDNHSPSNISTQNTLDKETANNHGSYSLRKIPHEMIYIFTSILTGTFCMMFAICCCIRICYDYQRKMLKLESVEMGQEGDSFKDSISSNRSISSDPPLPALPEGLSKSLTVSVDEEEEEKETLVNIVSNTTSCTLPAIPEEQAHPILDAMLSNESTPPLPPNKPVLVLNESTPIHISYGSHLYPAPHSTPVIDEINDRNLEERMKKCYFAVTEMALNEQNLNYKDME